MVGERVGGRVGGSRDEKHHRRLCISGSTTVSLAVLLPFYDIYY